MTDLSSIVLRASAAADEHDLLVYGNIGSSWFDEGITAKAVSDQLRALPRSVRQINIKVNSFGGSVVDGLAIYNALRDHPAKKVAVVDGVAMSIASLILMAGDEVQMPETSLLMIHAPWGGMFGNAEEMRQYADVLDTFAEAMIGAYTRKTGKSADEIRSLLTDGEDHYYTGAEAVAAGFVDSIKADATTSTRAEASPENRRRNLTMAAGMMQAHLHKAPEKTARLAVAASLRATITSMADLATQEAPVAVEPVAAQPGLPAEESMEVVALRNELDGLRAEAASAKAQLAAEVEAKEIRAATDGARTRFNALPMDAAEIGPALRTLRASSPKACEAVESLLAKCNALLAQGQTLDPVGKTVEASTETVTEKISRLVAEKRKENPLLSEAKAASAVYAENKDLYAAVNAVKKD